MYDSNMDEENDCLGCGQLCKTEMSHQCSDVCLLLSLSAQAKAVTKPSKVIKAQEKKSDSAG